MHEASKYITQPTLHNTILKVSKYATFLSVQFFKFWRKHIHLCFMFSLHCYFPVSLISVSMHVCLSFFSIFLFSFLLLFTLLCFIVSPSTCTFTVILPSFLSVGVHGSERRSLWWLLSVCLWQMGPSPPCEGHRKLQQLVQWAHLFLAETAQRLEFRFNQNFTSQY